MALRRRDHLAWHFSRTPATKRTTLPCCKQRKFNLQALLLSKKRSPLLSSDCHPEPRPHPSFEPKVGIAATLTNVDSNEKIPSEVKRHRAAAAMSSPARGRGGARGRGRGGSRSANNSDDESVRQSTRRTRANNTTRTPSSSALGRGAGRGLQGALGQVRLSAVSKRGNQSSRGNTSQSNGSSRGAFGVSTSRSTNRIAPSVAERLKTVRYSSAESEIACTDIVIFNLL